MHMHILGQAMIAEGEKILTSLRHSVDWYQGYLLKEDETISIVGSDRASLQPHCSDAKIRLGTRIIRHRNILCHHVFMV